MRYQRVALISPRYAIGPNAIADHPPAGLGYLAEALESTAVDYIVIDQRLGYTNQALLSMITEYRPDLVGISMMTYLHQDTYATIGEIKTACPETDIVVGGPHASTLRETVLKECPDIDYAVVLEGEGALKELCQGIPLAKIKGLIYRTKSGIVFNGDRPFQHLDDMAFPCFSKFELDKYLTSMIPLVTSRGCPYNCIYCPVEKAIGKRFRMRSAESVFLEIKYWRDRSFREYLILDDNFTLNPRRVLEICDLVKDDNLNDLNFGLPNGIRADRIDRSMLKTMKDVGFTKLAFGVEAGNDKVLSEIDKGEGIERIEESIRAACELGFGVTLFFLIGSPSETWEDFMDSINLARRYPVDEVRFYNLIPFPGTRLFEWVKANDYLVQDPSTYLNSASHFTNSPCFATPEMSLRERRKAFNLATKVARQVKKKALSRRLAYLGPLAGFVAVVYTNLRRLRYADQAMRKLRSAIAKVASAG
ncbi:MAG: B12-binding domain-containing radical SAM protein [Actinobacteria bacterium]|nr:B12-binding domain-containing radical SAM protein [Actinomycetota bacterium]